MPRTFAFALGGLLLAACGPPEKVVTIYPPGSEAAEALFEVDFWQRFTPADNFILRPDEFASVATDPARGLLYLGSRAGRLLAFDAASGELAWELPFEGAVSSVPVLARLPDDPEDRPSLLLVGTDNGELVAVQLDDREVAWRYRTEGKVRNAPLVHEGVVYFANSRDQVFALELRTGAWRWQYEQEFQTDFTIHGRAGITFVPAPEAADGATPAEVGTLYTGFDNGKVAALGASSGEAVWLASVAPPEGGNFVDCDSTPLVDLEGGRVIVTGQATGVHALSMADGSTAWSFAVPASSSVAAGPGGELYTASSLQGIFSLDLDGRLRWRTPTDPGMLSVPVVVDDTVYVTHADQGLLALDGDTGDYVARLDLGSGMSSVPTYDPLTERFYATTNRGYLLALRLRPPLPLVEPWTPAP